MPLLQQIIDFLMTYEGRDVVIRASSYGSAFLTAFFPGQSEKLASIQGRLSSARVVLRLFDDLPMLMYTRQYALYTKEHPVMKILGNLSNILNQLYLPLEHIAWLGDLQVLKVNSSRWWSGAILMWGLALYTNLVKSLLTIYGIRKVRAKLVKQKKYGALDGSEENTNKRIDDLTQKEHIEKLKAVEAVTNLMNAINWMPKGFLWASKFPKSLVGLLGLISSLSSIYLMWMQQQTPVKSNP